MEEDIEGCRVLGVAGEVLGGVAAIEDSAAAGVTEELLALLGLELLVGVAAGGQDKDRAGRIGA